MSLEETEQLRLPPWLFLLFSAFLFLIGHRSSESCDCHTSDDCVPQGGSMGPLYFGGGNTPAFVLASLSALAAGIIAILKLPHLSSNSFKSPAFHFG